MQKVSIGPLLVLVLTTRGSDRGLLEIQHSGGEGSPGKTVKNFHELKAWQKAPQLTLAVYQITATFPREELYGLTTQMRRSCSSMAANLAEGCGRNGDAELARFCSIAWGSASELEYHLLLARDLQIITAENYARLSDQTIEVKRILTGLLQKLKAER